MRNTDAWVLYEGPADARTAAPGVLVRESFELPEVGPVDVLVEPIYGCWEANMAHAIARHPIDVCRDRREKRVVLGNSGIVRVVEAGRDVTTARVGDVCLVFGNGVADDAGYMVKAMAYDAPHTMGVLAKQSVMHQSNVIPVPREDAQSPAALRRWAAFSLRYVTAWANWRVAFGCWRVQMDGADIAAAHVWGWGGGTTLGELQLAKMAGFEATMIASTDARLALIAGLGLKTLDRRQYPGLVWDEERYRADKDHRRRYQAAEEAFLAEVRARTGDKGVSIFVDYIGTPVERATLRSLARQGVLATAGWKHGMASRSVRAVECIARHVHVHTHYARYREGLDAVGFAVEHGWLPPVPDDTAVWPFEEIGALAEAYEADRVAEYFPLFQVNAA